MGGRLNRYWVGPDDVSASRPEQKYEAPLQLVQDLDDSCLVQLQAVCDKRGRHRLSEARQIFNDEVMHAPMVVIQAAQNPFGLLGSPPHGPSE